MMPRGALHRSTMAAGPTLALAGDGSLAPTGRDRGMRPRWWDGLGDRAGVWGLVLDSVLDSVDPGSAGVLWASGNRSTRCMA
jgi:hypothetical protein